MNFPLNALNVSINRDIRYHLRDPTIFHRKLADVTQDLFCTNNWIQKGYLNASKMALKIYVYATETCTRSPLTTIETWETASHIYIYISLAIQPGTTRTKSRDLGCSLWMFFYTPDIHRRNLRLGSITWGISSHTKSICLDTLIMSLVIFQIINCLDAMDCTDSLVLHSL